MGWFRSKFGTMSLLLVGLMIAGKAISADPPPKPPPNDDDPIEVMEYNKKLEEWKRRNPGQNPNTAGTTRTTPTTGPATTQPPTGGIDVEATTRLVILRAQLNKLITERRHKEAIPVAVELLSLVEKMRGARSLDAAATHHNLASCYKGAGDYRNSEQHYLKAISLHESLVGPSAPELVPNLSGICSLYTDSGDFNRAEAACKRSVAIAEKVSPGQGLISSLNNLAEVYKRRGDVLKAEQLFRRALDLYRANNETDTVGVGEVTKNLADTMVMRGQFAEAQRQYELSLQIFEQKLGKDHYLVAVALDGLAEALRAQAVNMPRDQRNPVYARCEQARLRVVQIFEATLGPQHPYTISGQNNLAHLYQSMGRVSDAEALMRALIEKARASLGPEHPDYVKQLGNLAVLTAQAGKLDSAISQSDQVLELARRVFGPNSRQVSVLMHNLALTLRSAGNLKRAVEVQTRADEIDDAELVRVLAVGSDSARRAFASTLNGQFYATVSMHADGAPQSPEARRMAATAVLRRKGRLLDASADVMKRIRENLGPAERELLEKTRLAHGLLAQASSSGDASAVKSLEAALQNLQEQVASKSAEYRRETHAVTLADVQARLPADGALVEILFRFTHKPNHSDVEEEFDLRQPRYIAYVIRKTGDPVAVDLGPTHEIDALAKDFRKSLASPNATDFKAIGRKLDAKVMQPVRQLLGDETLLFVSPDGQLSLVPFGALVDERDRFLVSRYTFDYLASGRDLLRPPPADGAGPPLIVANPDFDSGQSPSASGDSRSRGVDLSKVTFQALPGTAQEGAAIGKSLPGSRTLMGADATKRSLLSAKSPSILHIATHGFFLSPDAAGGGLRSRGLELDASSTPATASVGPSDPLLRSGLIFAGANRHGVNGGDDGIATALEVADMDLRGTKLVVLSACETGVGDVELGDGIYGLRRALAIAGADTQVMSLWKVDDNATRDLMVSYYRKLQEGKGRAVAMREVQTEMLSSSSHAKPYYWGAFVVSGGWGPLQGGEGDPGRVDRPSQSLLPKGLIVLPRIGASVWGTGSAKGECSSQGDYSCASGDSFTKSFDFSSAASFGFDVLVAPTRGLRLGVGATYVPSTKMSNSTSKLDAGSDLSIVAILEPVIPIGSRTGIALRGQGGMTLLFPSGDLSEMVSDAKRQCDGIRATGASCSVTDGNYLGWTAGGGLGVLYAVGGARLRGDVGFHYFSVSTLSQEVNAPTGSGKSSLSLTAQRVIFTGGVEF